jgi:hypothetical protein
MQRRLAVTLLYQCTYITAVQILPIDNTAVWETNLNIFMENTVRNTKYSIFILMAKIRSADR